MEFRAIPASVEEENKDAWYGGSDNLAENCEKMLNSAAWQNANTSTYDGLIKRFELMEAAGLPRMHVISSKKLISLGRIPRYEENMTEDAIDVVKKHGPGKGQLGGLSKTLIGFLSHRWIRPNWNENLQRDVPWGSPERAEADKSGCGDPDDSSHSKARAVGEWTKWFEVALKQANYAGGPLYGYGFNLLYNLDDLEMYLWIDWACVDQLNPSQKGKYMKALPAYVAISHYLASYWCTTDYKGEAMQYDNRAWCEVERMNAYSFMTTGNYVMIIPKDFKFQGQSKAHKKIVPVPDPAATAAKPGGITNPMDISVIEGLRNIASRSSAFTCIRNCIVVSTTSWSMCICGNICCLLQCFGFLPYRESRDTRPGKGTQIALTPC